MAGINRAGFYFTIEHKKVYKINFEGHKNKRRKSKFGQ